MTRYAQPAADRLALLARALRTTADLLGLEADGAENPEVMRALVTSAELTVREIGAIVWRLEGRATAACLCPVLDAAGDVALGHCAGCPASEVGA